MFRSLDLLILTVSNMESSVAFYKNILGLKLKAKSAEWSTFALSDVELALQPAAEELADERPVKHGVTFGFKVEDVEAAYTDLKSKGAHFLAIPREGNLGRYAEIADPDGHVIIILEGREKGD